MLMAGNFGFETELVFGICELELNIWLNTECKGVGVFYIEL